ncbi:MAG: ATP-binding protein [Stagnimonas sp.]|nr:ATP-binding protein [Stagnimonas sp.]
MAAFTTDLQNPVFGLTPRKRFALALLIFGIAVAAASVSILRTPWLGVLFQPSPVSDGMRVDYVDASGPAQGLLAVGDVVIWVASASGERLLTPADAAQTDLKTLRDSGRIETALQQVGALHRLLASTETIRLGLSDGRELSLPVTKARPIRSLPMGLFWVQFASAALSLVISAGLWSFRPSDSSAIYFVLAGALFCVLPTMALVTFNVGPFGDPALLRPLIGCTKLCALLAGSCMVGFAWNYPRQLRRASLAPLITVAVSLLWWFGESTPGASLTQAYFAPLFLLFILGVLLYTLQWLSAERGSEARRTGGLLAIINIVGFMPYQLLHALPQALGHQPLISAQLAMRGVQMIYVATAFLIYRYRLFGTDRWMFNAWLVFLSGALMLTTDALLVLGMELHRSTALWLSTVIAAWAYFPLRLWLWERLAKRAQRIDLADMIPRILEWGAASPPGSDEAWRRVLHEVFNPLHLTTTTAPSESPKLAPDCLSLKVPDGTGMGTVVLHGAEQGGRYFTERDVQLAASLEQAYLMASRSRTAFEQGQKMERQRIARDLHDDVVPPLLSVIFKAAQPELRDQGRQLMGRLRQQIQELGSPQIDVQPDEASAAAAAVALQPQPPAPQPPRVQDSARPDVVSWLLGGSLVALMILLAHRLLELDDSVAVWVGLALGGLAYAPARWLLRLMITGARRGRIDNAGFNQILSSALQTVAADNLKEDWRKALEQHFPARIQWLDDTRDSVTSAVAPSLLDRGHTLRLPAVGEAPPALLHCVRGGWFRRFGKQDLQLATDLHGLFAACHRYRLTLETGEHFERQRLTQRLGEELSAPLRELKSAIGDHLIQQGLGEAIWRVSELIEAISKQRQSIPALFEKLTEETRLRCQEQGFAYTGDHDISTAWELPARSAQNLTRIVRESVTNALRHSGGSRLDLKAFVDDARTLRLRISDSGCGFDVNQPANGHGLKNLRERARQMGAQLRLNSAKGHGCSIELQLPLDAQLP